MIQYARLNKGTRLKERRQNNVTDKTIIICNTLAIHKIEKNIDDVTDR